jgi:hypothetical protein
MGVSLPSDCITGLSDRSLMDGHSVNTIEDHFNNSFLIPMAILSCDIQNDSNSRGDHSIDSVCPHVCLVALSHHDDNSDM